MSEPWTRRLSIQLAAGRPGLRHVVTVLGLAILLGSLRGGLGTERQRVRLPDRRRLLAHPGRDHVEHPLVHRHGDDDERPASPSGTISRTRRSPRPNALDNVTVRSYTVTLTAVTGAATVHLRDRRARSRRHRRHGTSPSAATRRPSPSSWSRRGRRASPAATADRPDLAGRGQVPRTGRSRAAPSRPRAPSPSCSSSGASRLRRCAGTTGRRRRRRRPRRPDRPGVDAAGRRALATTSGRARPPRRSRRRRRR